MDRPQTLSRAAMTELNGSDRRSPEYRECILCQASVKAPKRKAISSEGSCSASIRRPVVGRTSFALNPHTANLLDVVKKKRLDIVSKCGLDLPTRVKFPKYKLYADPSHLDTLDAEAQPSGRSLSPREATTSANNLRVGKRQSKKHYLPRVKQPSCLAKVCENAKGAWQTDALSDLIEHRENLSSIVKNQLSASGSKIDVLHFYLNHVNQMPDILRNKRITKQRGNGKFPLSNCELRSIQTLFEEPADATTCVTQTASLNGDRSNQTYQLAEVDLGTQSRFSNSDGGTMPKNRLSDESSFFGSYSPESQHEGTPKRSKMIDVAKRHSETPFINSDSCTPSAMCMMYKEREPVCNKTSDNQTCQTDFDPHLTLQNNCLRLTKTNIETLEAMCLEKGIEPELHSNSDPVKYNPEKVNIFADLRQETIAKSMRANQAGDMQAGAGVVSQFSPPES